MQISVWLESSQSKCWTISSEQIEYLRHKLPEVKVEYARTADEFLRVLPQTETALCWFFQQDWFANAPRLRYIVTPAAGFDYFNVTPPRGIKVINSQFQGPLIAETVLGMMLSQIRGVTKGIESMRSSEWPRQEITESMCRFSGSHVLILGFGHIGRAIGRLAASFGCRITGIKQNPEVLRPDYFREDDRILPVSRLHEVLPKTDHLVLCLPRTPRTDRIIGPLELSLLPHRSVLYNVGRGNAVDEAALIEALVNRQIAAAYLDVFEKEPLPGDSPLRSLNNCYLMPHSSAASPDYLNLFIDDFVPRYLSWH